MNCITFFNWVWLIICPPPRLLPLLQPQPPLPHLHLSTSSHSQFISSVLLLPLSHDPPIHSHPVSNMFLTLRPKRLCNTATKTLGGGREYIALLANHYLLFVLPVFILSNGDYKVCHTMPTGADTSWRRDTDNEGIATWEMADRKSWVVTSPRTPYWCSCTPFQPCTGLEWNRLILWCAMKISTSPALPTPLKPQVLLSVAPVSLLFTHVFCLAVTCQTIHHKRTYCHVLNLRPVKLSIIY